MSNFFLFKLFTYKLTFYGKPILGNDSIGKTTDDFGTSNSFFQNIYPYIIYGSLAILDSIILIKSLRNKV